MKMLFPLLVLIFSLSAWADQSDFERGYDAGLTSCSAPTTLVICSGPAVKALQGNIVWGEHNAYGYSKAQALGKFSADYIAAVLAQSLKFNCTTVAQ